MAVFLPEPHAMAISRSPSSSKFHNESIDYRMLPRSSGDGMEHSGTSTETKTNSLQSSKKYQSYKNDSTKNSYCSDQSVDNSFQTKVSEIHDYSLVRSSLVETSRDQSKTSRTNNEYATGRLITNDVKDVTYSRKDNLNDSEKSTSKLCRDVGLPKENSVIHLSSNSSKSLNHDSAKLIWNDVFENSSIHEYDDDLDEDKDSQESEEVLKLQNTIKELEERNAKLVEDKTKLCVQLGYQTEVNAELKKLVVAAVGEDLENSLEALLMRNAQSAVEIKHWKTLSEEYAEESDKLAIECDVWRTKFMASRMMSDELSSWKTTLYTKYKQAQSAIQRILKEREELKKYLTKTNRLLHVLADSLNVGNTSYKDSMSENFNESVLELASVISALVQDLTNSFVGEVESLSVLPENHTLSEDSVEKQNVKPTPGEQIAIQVLTSNVELHTNDQLEDSRVMKRLGKQYIGNSYQSRLTTNSFRVTYDCCDRCKGAVQVV